MSKQRRKLVVVGDGAVGKTTLLTTLARGEFPAGYIPTVFENYVLDLDVRGELIELALWDTAAQGIFEDYLRPLSYADTHAFLLCFSIGWPDSLDNVMGKWDPEIKRFGAGKVPRFLVGCKKDLRYDQETLQQLAQNSRVPVTTEQGKEVAKVISATYVECSSKTGEGVRELFAQVTESMEAERVVRNRHRHQDYHHTPWYRKAGCIVV